VSRWADAFAALSVRQTNMGAGESDHRRYWILTKLTNFE